MNEHLSLPTMQLAERDVNVFLKNGFYAGPVFGVKVSPAGLSDER